MKNALIIYRVYADDPSSQGIYVKMRQQAEAISSYGFYCDMCFLTSEGIFINDTCIYKCNLNLSWNKFLVQLLFFHLVVNHIEKHYDIYYIRYAPLSFRLLSAFRILKETNPIIYLELPTYPYLSEYSGIKRAIVRLLSYREKYFKNYINAILHLGKEKEMFQIPVIHFENGINVHDYHPKKPAIITNRLNILAVGSLWPWQGLERVLYGMNDYKKTTNLLKIYLTIVGNGKEKFTLIKLAEELGLLDEVNFVDASYGNALDDFFDKAHIAAGKLAIHKINLTYNRSLKHREYGARGIPFFYAGSDPSFDDKSYVLKFTDDEKPIDMQEIVNFILSIQTFPTLQTQMRKDAETEYSWKKQFLFLKNEAIN